MRDLLPTEQEYQDALKELEAFGELARAIEQTVHALTLEQEEDASKLPE